MSRRTANSSLSTVIILTMLSGVFLFQILVSSLVHADESVIDEIMVTVPVSCSLSGVGMNTHNAEIPNGTYQANIGTTTLTAFCNDNEGFAIYASGYTGNVIGDVNSNKLIGVNSSAIIETGLATSTGNPDVSNWAMKLAISQDSGDTTGTNAFAIDSAPNLINNTPTGTAASFSQYHTVPNEYTLVAHKNAATDMNATTGGVKLTTTYAAYISKTEVADTYAGQVIYTLVHPSSHAAPFICNSSGTTISAISCMQDMNSSNASSVMASMTEGELYTLVDSRDGKRYYVAKLADGNIWMMQNLDHDIDSSRTYTNEDTDIGYNPQTGQYETATWTPIRSTYAPTATHAHEWCVGGEWNPSSYISVPCINDTPESYDPGDLYWNATEDVYTDWTEYTDTCDWSTNTPICDQNENQISVHVSSIGARQYHLGNYYNWAATLATNDSSAFYNSDVLWSLELIEQSICPSGWTIPRVGEGEDTYKAMFINYPFSIVEDVFNTPLVNLNISGRFNGILSDVGTSVSYWSPISFSQTITLDTYINISEPTISVLHGGNLSDGAPIRCIARPVTNTVIIDLD